MKTETKAPLGIDAEPEPALPASLAKQRESAMAALKPNCGNCACSHFSLPAEDSWGECRVHPPRMQIIAMPPRVQGQGPVYQPLSAWPPVQRTQWCVTGFMVKPQVTQ